MSAMKLKWLIISLLVPVLCTSQTSPPDSLIRLLPYLQDTGRINCLNKISLAFYINALSEIFENVQTDSAISYASQAHAEALKINYIKGIAEAIQNLGEIARDRGNYLQGENYFRQSIPLFQKIQAHENYSWANLTLGYCLYRQYKFSDAKVAYDRAMLY
ncbi:MAG: tetratricopeptide repeat protein, partial [Chitinophagaceae bacterium]